MEGFIAKPTIEEKNISQASKLKNFKDPLDNFDPKISDFSLADSFLDFDSIKEFFEDNQQNPDRISLEKIEFGVVEKSLHMSEEGKTHFGDRILHGSDPVVDGSGCVVKVEALEYEREKDLSCCIEDVMGKVSLVGEKSDIVSDVDMSGKVGLDVGSGSDLVYGSCVKSEIPSDKDESESNSESEDESSTSSSSSSGSGSGSGSSSSSSSSSSDDDGDDEEAEEDEAKMAVKRKVVVAGDIEEGEIVGVDDGDDEEEEEKNEEDTVGGSDVEFNDVAEDENGGSVMEGPIMSKNELQVLPPVPQVNVTLQPHHQMLPVGVVLSVIGLQVIVEGVEKHNPLNEGSILWITESRSPLGLIDEIFGPVKNPYYMVRYNSESDIPAGVHVGSLISFVQEFANHVLNEKNLYKKGYDASGENDEELSDGAEFSDDEKEAEYRRKFKMEKRGMTDEKPGNRKNNRKKGKNRDGTWKNDRYSQMVGVSQPIPNENQYHVPSVSESLDRGNRSSSSAIAQGFVGGIGLVPQFPPMAQAAGFTSSNGVWINGMPSQQLQNAIFANGISTNSMPWPSQNYQQHPYQPIMNNAAPFLQQFNPSQTLPGGQPSIFGGPTYAPWPGFVGQNSLNQMIGGSLSGQPAHPSVNAGDPGFLGQNALNQTIGMVLPGQTDQPSVNTGKLVIPSNGEQNNFQAADVLPGSIGAPQQFNIGASSNRGRKPYHRGGRFAGGRGRQQSR